MPATVITISFSKGTPRAQGSLPGWCQQSSKQGMNPTAAPWTTHVLSTSTATM